MANPSAVFRAMADGAPLLNDITFDLRGGEILCVAGIAGNGQSELLEALSGMRAPGEGSISILGEEFSAGNSAGPEHMRSLRLAHIPEDRHKHGLVLGFEARENAVLGYHRTELCGQGRLFLLEDTQLRKQAADHGLHLASRVGG